MHRSRHAREGRHTALMPQYFEMSDSMQHLPFKFALHQPQHDFTVHSTLFVVREGCKLIPLEGQDGRTPLVMVAGELRSPGMVSHIRVVTDLEDYWSPVAYYGFCPRIEYRLSTIWACLPWLTFDDRSKILAFLGLLAG